MKKKLAYILPGILLFISFTSTGANNLISKSLRNIYIQDKTSIKIANVSTGYDYNSYCSYNKWEDRKNLNICNFGIEKAVENALNRILKIYNERTIMCWFYFYDLNNENKHPDSELFDLTDKFIAKHPYDTDLSLKVIMQKSILSSWPIPQQCLKNEATQITSRLPCNNSCIRKSVRIRGHVTNLYCLPLSTSPSGWGWVSNGNFQEALPLCKCTPVRNRPDGYGVSCA